MSSRTKSRREKFAGQIITGNIRTTFIAIITGIILIFLGILGFALWTTDIAGTIFWTVMVVAGAGLIASGSFCGYCASKEPDPK